MPVSGVDRSNLISQRVAQLVGAGQAATAEAVNASLPADVAHASAAEIAEVAAKAIAVGPGQVSARGGDPAASPAYSRFAEVQAAPAPSARDKKIQDVASFVASTLRQNPNTGVTKEQAVERWGAKADDALDFWKTSGAQQYFRSCVSYLNCDQAGNWPDRTFQQVADIALWTDIMTEKGALTARPQGKWMKAVECALVGIELGPNSDIGHPEEHWRAGQNAGSYASSYVDREVGALVQALIACSSQKGLKLESAFNDLDATRAEVKKMCYGREPTFLADKQGLRTFLEALFLVKLSDMSRGSHGKDKASLAQSRVATSGMVKAFEKANKAFDPAAAPAQQAATPETADA
jgi:hypothetical protein